MKIVQEKTSTDICSHIVMYNLGDKAFHWHNRYEICQVVKNSCRFLVDGKIIQANEGDIIVINEKIVHRFLIDSDDTLIRITQFPVKLLMDVSTIIKPLKMHIKAEEINAVPNLKETIDSLLDIMEKEGAVEKLKENHFVKSVYAALYFLLMRNFFVEETEGSSKNDRKDFFKITEYVNEHFKEDINFNTIASNVYISRRRLPELFFKYSGTGLNDYINTLRVKNANELLRNGSNITEAAFESGFQSVRTFNFVYKACMGFTPTEYIKKYINTREE